ncbi:hypothetical protein WMY93_010531 [Mugilogobius chulae]|uniref:Protoheme IX farnesyltransferase, mitochondrial n=1 Tax=Mugilogobius chulae TaxID=88201 RepID=A0AAW0PGI1_9GOBI
MDEPWPITGLDREAREDTSADVNSGGGHFEKVQGLTTPKIVVILPLPASIDNVLRVSEGLTVLRPPAVHKLRAPVGPSYVLLSVQHFLKTLRLHSPSTGGPGGIIGGPKADGMVLVNHRRSCSDDSFEITNETELRQPQIQTAFTGINLHDSSFLLQGLVGASLKQKLLQNVPRCNHSTRSIIKLYRRDPSDWLTYQHLNFLKRQYVTKNRSGLHQRAFPKQQPVVTVLEEAEDAVERQVQRIPTIGPEQEELSGEAKPKVSNVDPSTKDVAAPEAKANEMGTSEEAPHIQEETELAKVARLDRQWKELKVETSDLPDVYARLAKIKLTALVVMTAAAGYAMAPVPFDPLTFFIASLGTGLASSAANSINQAAHQRLHDSRNMA